MPRPTNRQRRRPSRTLALGASVLAIFALGYACQDGGDHRPGWSNTITSWVTSTPTATTEPDGGPFCYPPSHEGYDPDNTCWVPVTWPTPCPVERAVDPKLGAPPLEWVPCADGVAGCAEVMRQSVLDYGLSQQASVVPWGAGIRIGISEWSSYPDNAAFAGQVAAVYETTGQPLVAWRTRSTGCILPRPIVTAERVWFGAVHVDSQGFTTAAYVAPAWDELATVTTNIPVVGFAQAWWASSTVAALWLGDGRTLAVQDLATQEVALWGGMNGHGNPDYSYANVVGDTVLALTAPGGYPTGTIWTPGTGVFQDVIDAPGSQRVADFNSDGATLAWVVVPYWGGAGTLWTSPLGPAGSVPQPALRRTTPPVRAAGSAAGSGYYAVFSPHDTTTWAAGDGGLHVYRLSDARHWSSPIPASAMFAAYIYHVDAHQVFYSGNGPLMRQDLDLLGPGDLP